MRVAIYSGAVPSTTFIDNLIFGLADKGVDVYLFGNKRGSFKTDNKLIKDFSISSNKIYLICDLFYLSARALITNPFRLKKLYSHLKYINKLYSLRHWLRFLPVILHLPDIFHLQWCRSISEWSFLKSYGVKLVVSFRGNQMNIAPNCDEKIAQMYREYLPFYDGYHCVSKAIMAEGSKYAEIKNKAVVIYPAIKKELLESPLSVRKDNDILQILSVGREHWKKGYRVAIDALKLLKDEGVKFHYTIVSGGEKQEIRHQIHQLELTSEITLIDNLPHDEVIKEYSNADVFLLPSFEEGVANVVLESMALKTFVISTDCGGMKEVIKDGSNGFIIPIRDSIAIKDAILRYLTLTPDERADMINNAVATIKENHLLDLQLSRMISLYNKVLDE